MFENITKNHSETFNEILKARRSVRAFSTTPPSKEEINEIIKAGLIAPYALFPAIGKKDFRKVIVISANSRKMAEAAKILDDRVKKYLVTLNEEVGEVPFVKVTKQLEAVGILKGLSNAPYLLISAERKGIPDIPEESLSYCMNNMWLKVLKKRMSQTILTDSFTTSPFAIYLN